MSEKLTIIKHQGETIIGELVATQADKVTLRNPASLFIQPAQNGQLTVQLFPVFFNELLENNKRASGTVWEYNTAGVAIGTDVAFDEKLVAQYNKIFNPSPIIIPEGSGKVVKLFDD